MAKRNKRRIQRHQRPLLHRVAIDVAGFGLLVLAVLTGWLPGPGGIPLFLLGLGVLSLNYEWADRLLKNFDARRREYTDKYLMASREVSLAMDGISLVLLAGGAYGLFHVDKLWQQGILIGLILLAVVTLLSNQKRLERFIAYAKKSS